MSIRIDDEKCIGCGACTDVCPGSLLALGEGGKAYIRIPSDCWGCCSCLKQCPAQAIELFLGADIGGGGARMSFERKDGLYEWTVHFPGGDKKTITVDPQRSNKY